MKIPGCVALALVLLSTVALAEPTPREAKVAELLRITGLAEMLEQTQATVRAEAGNLSNRMLKEIFKDGKAPSGEQQEQIEAAMQRFVEACAPASEADTAAALWGRLYAANLSDQELDEILRWYRSPIGQKDVAASKAATPQWVAELTSRSAAAMQGALERLNAELKDIARGTGGRVRT